MTDATAAGQLASATPSGADESLHESLSAAVDDEAEELELRRVLNAMHVDPELRAKWRRAHIVRSAIRGEPTRLGRDKPLPWRDDAEQDDVAADVPRSSNLRRHGVRWLGGLAGTGIAAGVALGIVALFGEGGLGALGIGSGTGASGEGTPANAPPAVASRANAPSGFAQLPSETDLRRANAYLLQHAQHAVAASPPASMPFAKVLASHDGSTAPVPVRYQREQTRQ